MTDFGFGEELERNLRDAENSMSKVNEMKDRIAATVGEGEAADGRIKAEFAGEGGLRALDLDPRVMRLPSQELSEQIMAAVNAAAKDFQEKIASISGELFGGGSEAEAGRLADPKVALANVEKLGNAFAGKMQEVLRELTAQQQSAKDAMGQYRDPRPGN